MARIGRQIFYDQQLSGSGRLSCASCHDPAHHYGPSGKTSVFVAGGTGLNRPGRRAIPSLAYLDTIPNFSIGPDNPESEGAPVPVLPASGPNIPVRKTARGSATATMVPQGGLFWDGRADTLQQQAAGPLFDPSEMAADPKIVIHRFRSAPYTALLLALSGPAARQSDQLLLSEALFAVARYQIEEQAFHPYSSRFDDWLEGRAHFTPAEQRGYLLFNDPAKGNCAACHPDRPLPGNFPPLLTDHQYEALGVPRNINLMGPAGNGRFDLGLCKATPGSQQNAAAYCGMFVTPTLRNAADRKVFFHNGVFHDLHQVMDFYVLRDIEPEQFYNQDAQDLPKLYEKNIDRMDAPLDRTKKDTPALTKSEREDIISFLKTLVDQPAR
ncbi:cytochrome-c peroxidase [Gluconobacter morbifer]|uniref:Putative di-heme cytochrome c peroxidase n=1 Tax=Gluconobacter morbifer G707 TaxID=1088869 RepID=G6XL93_9PROT|nr:putative di-heme cytochrome c peroxidase [Gluconobacter morbifer G707]